ncbi:MAG: ankyrin repeat domain-containing protein, partial [Betaproteobacteria bacterium]|nr:ankyrin repeat domain-containing protein [Betaproteobacteria bacterium]
AGADLKVRDLKGNTVMHAAADGGYEELVRLLLLQGVDPKARNREGRLPLDMAREREHKTVVEMLEKLSR